MHESYKKWLDDGCPKVYCNCHDHEEIIIKKHHKRFGIPKYINHHFGKGGHLSEKTKQKISKGNKGKHNHTEEYKQMMHEKNVGENNPMYGRLGELHPMYGKKGELHPSFGTHPTEEQLEKMQGKFAELNPNWKGGITSLNNIIRSSNEYYEWRLQIFGRDNFTCQCCGIRGVYLEAHHIKQFNEIIKENNIKNIDNALNCEILWDLNNGITYYKECHEKLKKKGGILLI